MADETVSKELLLKRLRRVEGQIRGIQKMIESQRECESVITQLAAVRSAIEGVAGLILRNYMKICFRDEKAPECVDVESLARAIAIWGNVHLHDTKRGRYFSRYCLSFLYRRGDTEAAHPCLTVFHKSK
jgi:DNA-binding FrmR family transcriptional regulator